MRAGWPGGFHGASSFDVPRRQALDAGQMGIH
jgi:hypothetical protein